MRSPARKTARNLPISFRLILPTYLRVFKKDIIFIVLLSITIALTIRADDILLVNGFLVIPAAYARLICQQFVPFLATAAGMGTLSGVMEMVIAEAMICLVVRVWF